MFFKKNIFFISTIIVLVFGLIYLGMERKKDKFKIKEFEELVSQKAIYIKGLESEISQYKESLRKKYSSRYKRPNNNSKRNASSSPSSIFEPSPKKKSTKEKTREKSKEKPPFERGDSVDKLMGNYINEIYDDYFNEMNLPPEKKEKLTKVLIQSHQLQQNLVYMLFDSKVEDDSILKKQEELYNQQRNTIESILNKNEVDYLESYNQELPKKIAQKTIQSSIQHLDLSKEMKKDLSRLIYEEKHLSNSAPFGYGNNYGIPLKMLDQENITYIRNIDKPEQIEKIIAKTEAESEKIINRFKDEKNPNKEQLKAVKSYLDGATAMLKSISGRK